MEQASENYLKRLIESNYFQNTVVVIIVLNAVILGLETSDRIMAQYGTTLHTLDLTMLAFFVLEILTKLVVYRHRFFYDSWRVFDFVVIAIALLPDAGIFAVARTLRVLRVFRLISSMPHLRGVIDALIQSMPGISAIFFILIVIYYVFAVMATQLYGAEFPQWFGTLGRSAFTLFQIMTLESWSMGIVRPVMASYPYAWLFFVTFILASTFLMLNLFIAVVVDAMQKNNTHNK